jgi:hypothetical protein
MNLANMFRTADEDGECSDEIGPGLHVEQLRAEVEAEGYIFKTDGRAFSVIISKRQPINYPKAGTV